MRYGKIVVGLFSAVLLAVAMFGYLKEDEWDGTVAISAEIPSADHEEEVVCWGEEDGQYYIFLPSYADLSEVTIFSNASVHVEIDGHKIGKGISGELFQRNVPYDLCYMVGEQVYQYELTFVQSANVPTMYIDTPSGSMEFIHEEKGNEEPGVVRLYDADGVQSYKGNLDSINGRGNATWAHDKKPYSLRLSTAENLLGMGAAEKWILLTNSYDPTNLRNKLTYDLAEDAGMMYSPDCEWVDLYLNGEYAGLYLLSERNEVHAERVNLEQSKGFLISQELQYRLEEQGYPYVTTESMEYGSAFRIHYSNIGTDELAGILQSAENAIMSQDGIDPITGKSWLELIDLDSWVMKYLVEEVLGNFDAGVASQYFFYSGDGKTGKVYAGPVWDYDNILGRQHWQTSVPNALVANRPHIVSAEDAPIFHMLYQKKEFYERMVELYETAFRPLLSELLTNKLDQYIERIGQASEANKIRWNVDDSVENEKKIREFLEARIAFFDSLWLNEEEYCFVQVAYDAYTTWACYAIASGGYLPQLPGYQNSEDTTYYGWYTLDTDEHFDVTQPIKESVSIYLKSETAEPEPGSSDAEYEAYVSEEEEISLPKTAPLFILSSILAIVCLVDYLRVKRDGKKTDCKIKA